MSTERDLSLLLGLFLFFQRKARRRAREGKSKRTQRAPRTLSASRLARTAHRRASPCPPPAS